ncbi:MAG: hypothetical protein JWP25_4743, partial [Bradyrhizobium sp.]|nr:hypothetical protein [Bradyrhizobium sp.]
GGFDRSRSADNLLSEKTRRFTPAGVLSSITPEGALRASRAHDRLTEQRQTVPYVWMYPDEER